jgi:hypothetical protein
MNLAAAQAVVKAVPVGLLQPPVRDTLHFLITLRVADAPTARRLGQMNAGKTPVVATYVVSPAIVLGILLLGAVTLVVPTIAVGVQPMAKLAGHVI